MTITPHPHYADDTVTLHHGDAIDILRTLRDASVDAIVTDPPYGLEFMGREWDAPWRMIGQSVESGPGAFHGQPGAHTRGYANNNPRAFGAWCEAWAAECLRVLKPGGHLVAFGGTRTVHRLTCGIEDAGFEIRDGIDWLYGSGFPKSLDVSKAIDKRRDDGPDIARVAAWLADQADAAGVTRPQVDAHMGTSDMAGWWLSRLPHRCQVPTWEQWQRLRDLIGFRDEMDAEVWRLNGRKGTPGEAWEQRPPAEYRARPGMAESWTDGIGWTGATARGGAPVTDDAARWSGWGTALKPAREPIVVARKPLAGTVAANVLEHGTGALNIDACRVPGRERTDYGLATATRTHGSTYGSPSPSADFDSSKGRWPSNVVLSHAPLLDDAGEPVGDACAGGCVPGCPVAELDAQSGTSKSASGTQSYRRAETTAWRERGGSFTPGREWSAEGYADAGGASRFFPVFRYQAKAPARERPKVDGTAHPTVKPLGLMRWLVRLVTPPGGTVLDLFAGSGTTAEACAVEGFPCVAIEREADYLPLIVARMARADRPASTAPAPAPRRPRQKVDDGQPVAQLEGQAALFDMAD